MPITFTEKDTLLKIARCAIESAVKEAADPEVESVSPNLKQGRGAFVSLHKQGQLRGCIGTFASDKPLYKTVVEMSVAAATKDPRFSPVEPKELILIEIEISALSPLRKTDNFDEIEVGRHGIYIVKGLNRGVLLPQVAVELGLDRYEFLDHTCQKAGLSPGRWKSGAEVYIFEAEIFRENEGKAR